MNRQNLQVDSLKPKTNVMTSVLLQNVQLQTENNYREKKTSTKLTCSKSNSKT